jgi:hypothetical protein
MHFCCCMRYQMHSQCLSSTASAVMQRADDMCASAGGYGLLITSPHLKMRLTTFVSASLNPKSEVSCKDMEANRSPPRKSNVKIST